MIELITKKGCPYCEAFASVLNINGVEYSKVPSKGIAPQLYVDGVLVFKGLPDYADLIDWINDYNNRKETLPTD